MGDLFNKIFGWVKANIMLSIVALLAVVLLFFPRLFRKVFSAPRRRRRYNTRSGKPLPRSVGRRRIKRAYNKNGKQKKPWQIKGSEAARRHMARLRRMR